MNPQTVLITGSSRGLGLGFLKEFLKLSPAPETIIATCRDPDKATELKELAKKNPSIKLLKLDVHKQMDPNSLTKFAQDVENLLGGKGLNVLVNNAGIFQDISDFTLEEMTKFFTVNAFGPILLFKALLPLLKKASDSLPNEPISMTRAGVLQISSDAASNALNTTAVYKGRFCVYRGSKSALNCMTYNSSIEHEKDNILFVMIHPGTVSTDMTRAYAETEVGKRVAWITAEDSARCTLEVAAKCRQQDNGAYFNWRGEVMPW